MPLFYSEVLFESRFQDRDDGTFVVLAVSSPELEEQSAAGWCKGTFLAEDLTLALF